MIAINQIVLPNNLEKKYSELITPEKIKSDKMLSINTQKVCLVNLELTVEKDELNKVK